MREQLSAGTPVCLCGVCLRCVVQICVSEMFEFSNRKLQLRHDTCILLCGQYTSANEELAKIAFVVMLKLAEISLFALIFL